MNNCRVIETAFPALSRTGYKITSPPDGQYNCIAWAAGDCNRWWWPDPRAYWPPGVPRNEDLAAFESAYGQLGYTTCEFDQFEAGYEKIAVFVDESGAPTHAARQLPDGMWTSKLGKKHDISHTLNALEGVEYGKVARIMKRRIGGG